ncbi:MAG: GTP cyclohydrolase II [Rhizobiales bacterium]|nr:GTP cyclohydrolase II [Hyphomicrobiales bacterium]
MPVDGGIDDTLTAFRDLCTPAAPWLAVSARRARRLGIESGTGALLEITDADNADTVWSLAAQMDAKRGARRWKPAGRAAGVAMNLAKLAQRVPALLVADAADAKAAALDPRLIEMHGDAFAAFRQSLIDSVTLTGVANVPLRDGVSSKFHVFRDSSGGSPTAIVIGEPDFARPVPVRLHSACLTGDVFGSRRCDCGAQLQLAITRLADAGGGIILYLEQEGRGLGLANKMRAYALQDAGLDTVDANTALGFDDDERDYGVAARMLALLGAHRVLLMTNNPDKLEGLTSEGVDIVGRVPVYTPINADNRRYLTAKAARAGHWLDAALEQTDERETAAGGKGR